MPEERTEKSRALDLAVSQIEKQFGKGSIMRLGGVDSTAALDAISSGSLSLDAALGVGGFPRGRVIEIFGPKPRSLEARRHSSMLNMLSTRTMRASSAWTWKTFLCPSRTTASRLWKSRKS